MGLDTYARRAPEEELTAEDSQAFEAAGIELCGGIFSGGGGSFRGKVYDDLILEITGVSLYQEWIPPEQVREMYQAFAECEPEKTLQEGEADGRFWHEHSTDEIAELRAFFRVCAERGLGLAGWW